MTVYSFTACSGNRDFDENVDARRAALDAGSFAHASPDRSGGMFSLPVLFARSSLDMCHQSLELAFLKLSRVFARNEACADRKPAVHRSRAACFVLTPVSRHNASCYAKIENDLRYTQQTSYNTTFTETETGTDVTATGERP